MLPSSVAGGMEVGWGLQAEQISLTDRHIKLSGSPLRCWRIGIKSDMELNGCSVCQNCQLAHVYHRLQVRPVYFDIQVSDILL